MRTLMLMAAPLLALGVGAASLETTATAQAHTGPAPLVEPALTGDWCPGEYWDPGWGVNWDWNSCHDEHRSWWCPGDFWDPVWGFNENWGECHWSYY